MLSSLTLFTRSWIVDWMTNIDIYKRMWRSWLQKQIKSTYLQFKWVVMKLFFVRFIAWRTLLFFFIFDFFQKIIDILQKEIKQMSIEMDVIIIMVFHMTIFPCLHAPNKNHTDQSRDGGFFFFAEQAVKSPLKKAYIPACKIKKGHVIKCLLT